MRKISIDNGNSFVNPEEALQNIDLDSMTVYMDDDTREAVNADLAPCTDIEFLCRYLQLAEDDLIIG